MENNYSKDTLICSECGGVAYLATFIDHMPDEALYGVEVIV